MRAMTPKITDFGTLRMRSLGAVYQIAVESIVRRFLAYLSNNSKN
jgi:hypothetical protein